MNETIESHYAPEKVKCPSCEVIGEISYHSGTNHNPEKIPDRVEL